jgi:hypothetical protein
MKATQLGHHYSKLQKREKGKYCLMREILGKGCTT